MSRSPSLPGELPPALVSIAGLVQDLRLLGIAPGDTVMVHASMKALGPIEGGAVGVVEALDRALGASGTALMVLGAHDDPAWVNDRPEEERAALLADAKPFDCQTTPAESEVGVLAEVFRTTPGTLVSDHPEGRFAARGRLARSFVEDVPWNDYYGPGSPLQRLVEADGKVLRLGADSTTVTLLHYAEYLAAIPGKRRVRRHRRVSTPDGPCIRVLECLDDSKGIVDYGEEDYFTVILTEYLRTHNPRRGMVARASSEAINGAEIVDFATRWMTDNLR